VAGFGRLDADGPVSVAQLYHAPHGERLLKQHSRAVSVNHGDRSTGELVSGLRAEDFDSEFPLTVAQGIDRSWSMAGEPLRLARQASQAVLRALKPVDRAMVPAWIHAGGADRARHP